MSHVYIVSIGTVVHDSTGDSARFVYFNGARWKVYTRSGGRYPAVLVSRYFAEWKTTEVH